MKLGMLSDLHLTNEKPVGRIDTDMLSVGLDKLEQVFQYCYDNKIYDILQAGDCVDLKRSWELLSALTRFLKYWKAKGVKLYSILGQHDSYFHDMSNTKTIMGVLISAGLITRLTDEPTIIGKDKDSHQIYGASFGEEIPKIETFYKGLKILVIHKQILMSKIFNQQEGHIYAPTFLKENPDYDLILCGDAHQKFSFNIGKRIICNTGVMMRLEASEMMYEHKPSFAVYDTESRKLEFHELKVQDAEKVLSRVHLEKQEERKNNFDSFIKQVQESSEDSKELSFDKNLRIIIKQHKASENIKGHISEYMAKAG
jgi:predicted phosphodiesterase